MSRQFSFSSLSSSSSSSSSSMGPLYDSGVAQSMVRLSTENKYEGGSARKIPSNELIIGKSLGRGMYGEVFSGTYRENKVAIKTFDLYGKLSEEQKIAVRKEADLMTKLPPKSKYLIGFHGISLDSRYCLVMEYAEGGTLRARLDNTREAVTLAEQMRWVMQVSYGLSELHSLRIVHCDLKSQNILLDRDQRAKVADFGLSKVKEGLASQSNKSGGIGFAAGSLPCDGA